MILSPHTCNIMIEGEAISSSPHPPPLLRESSLDTGMVACEREGLVVGEMQFSAGIPVGFLFLVRYKQARSSPWPGSIKRREGEPILGHLN